MGNYKEKKKTREKRKTINLFDFKTSGKYLAWLKIILIFLVQKIEVSGWRRQNTYLMRIIRFMRMVLEIGMSTLSKKHPCFPCALVLESVRVPIQNGSNKQRVNKIRKNIYQRYFDFNLCEKQHNIIFIDIDLYGNTCCLLQPPRIILLVILKLWYPQGCCWFHTNMPLRMYLWYLFKSDGIQSRMCTPFW